jgi:glycosyltransferase involved in cell wall biosynthesis
MDEVVEERPQAISRLEQDPAHVPIRVAHLVSHPIQYFAPLYRELAKRPEIDLTVFFYSDATSRPFYDAEFGRTIAWDVPLLQGFRWQLLPSAVQARPPGGFLRRPNWDIVRHVMTGRYEVVWAHGYSHLTTWLVAAMTAVRGVPLLLREEQTLLRERSLFRRAVKGLLLRALFRRAHGLYIGEENRRYFRHYGVSPARLFPTPYCVDNSYFEERSAALARDRPRLRLDFGITDDAPVVLFCGKLNEQKQPLLLLEAFERVRARHACWLLLVGDGALRAAAEELVTQRRIPDVRFAGFLNQTEIATAYAASDFFVLPSTAKETWGLVVNEAMCFGLPCIVSDKVGCAPDLVRQGENGFVFPYQSAEHLAAAIERLVKDGELRDDLGARSRTIVRGYTIESCADGIVAACLAAARHQRNEDKT